MARQRAKNNSIRCRLGQSIAIIILGILHTQSFLQRQVHIKNNIAFHFETQTHLIRQHAYYTKRIDLSGLFQAISELYDSNSDTYDRLSRFINVHQPKLNVSENWTPPPAFEVGSLTPLPPDIARKLCEDQGKQLPEIMTYEDQRDFIMLMKARGVNQTFAGLYQDASRLTKRFISSGIPFNSGYTNNHIYYQDLKENKVLRDSDANTLHDDLDKIGTYTDDGYLVFAYLHPAYSTNRLFMGPSSRIGKSDTQYWRYNVYVPKVISRMAKEHIVDIDDWNLKLPIICQTPHRARKQAPTITPTEDFNNDLLTQALDAAKTQAKLGMQQSVRKMRRTAHLATKVGIGLQGLDAWYQAPHKQTAAKSLVLIFPGVDRQIQKRDTEIRPPLKHKRGLFSILSGVTMGLYRFNRERGINQRLDNIEQNHNDLHNTTRNDLRETDQALTNLELNQNNIDLQIRQLYLAQNEFKNSVLHWLDQIENRINPILHIQALTLKSVSLNQAVNQEIDVAHIQMESYTDAAILSHINSNILATEEFDSIALKLQEVTELRAVHNPDQIPCAMMPHQKPQSITIIFAIPLTEPEPYTLIKLIPLKDFQGKYAIIPRLQHQFVALSQDEYHYVQLTEPEYKECLKGPCQFLSVSSSVLADKCGMEQFFGHKPTPCEGVIVPEIPRDTFLPFGDLGTIFIIVDQATATISCLGRLYSGPTTLMLKGIGLLHVPPLCTAHIVGTPNSNSVRIRGPEATFLFRKLSPDGLLSQPMMTTTKLEIKSQINNPIETNLENRHWQDAVIGKTQKMVQQVSEKAANLATNFHRTFTGKTKLNRWLGGASVTIAIIITILGLIAVIIIWLKIKLFKQSVLTQIGDVISSVREKLRNINQKLDQKVPTNPTPARGVTFRAKVAADYLAKNQRDAANELPLLTHSRNDSGSGPSNEREPDCDHPEDD